MKVLIIIDTKKYKKHKEMAEMFKTALSEHIVDIYDMGCDAPEHEKFYAIKAAMGNVGITFDCAGFEMVNITEVLSYNSFTIRMAHIIFDKVYKFDEALKHMQNLSMFTYVSEGENMEKVKAQYTLIPNLDQHQLKVEALGSEQIRSWFSEFCKEAML